MVANCDSDSEIARMNRGVNSLPYTCTYNIRPNCHVSVEILLVGLVRASCGCRYASNNRVRNESLRG